MPHITEGEIGNAVLKILANSTNGESTIANLKKRLSDGLSLTDEDRTTSLTRPNEEIWEQRLRNLVSHRHHSEGNIIFEGFVEYIEGSGTLRITDSGRRYLENK